MVPGPRHLPAPVHSPHCWELREHQHGGVLHCRGDRPITKHSVDGQRQALRMKKK